MKRVVVIIVLLLLLIGLGFAAGRVSAPIETNVVEIPGEVIEKMVEVEVVRHIEVPVQLPPETVIVERVEWKTREVQVDREVLVNVCPDGDPEEDYEPQAYVDIYAWKVDGEVDGELRQGWIAQADCLVRRSSDSVWSVLASSELDNTESIAESVLDPAAYHKSLRGMIEFRAGLTSYPGLRVGSSWYRKNRRWGLWATADYNFDPDAGDELIDPGMPYHHHQFRVVPFSEPTWVVGAGLSRRFGRR